MRDPDVGGISADLLRPKGLRTDCGSRATRTPNQLALRDKRYKLTVAQPSRLWSRATTCASTQTTRF